MHPNRHGAIIENKAAARFDREQFGVKERTREP